MTYVCEDCGMECTGLNPDIPASENECDNCGGELTATDDSKAVTTQAERDRHPESHAEWLARMRRSL